MWRFLDVSFPSFSKVQRCLVEGHQVHNVNPHDIKSLYLLLGTCMDLDWGPCENVRDMRAQITNCSIDLSTVWSVWCPSPPWRRPPMAPNSLPPSPLLVEPNNNCTAKKLKTLTVTTCFFPHCSNALGMCQIQHPNQSHMEMIHPSLLSLYVTILNSICTA